MKRIALVCLSALASSPLTAFTLAQQTFVSVAGDDSNPCSIALSCRTLTIAMFRAQP